MKNDLYSNVFSKINLSDDKKAQLYSLTERKNNPAVSKNAVSFKKIIASAACVCIAAAVILGVSLYNGNDEDMLEAPKSSVSFSIMQVYADDTKRPVSGESFETVSPLYQVFRVKTNQNDAFDKSKRNEMSEPFSEGQKNGSEALYSSSEFLPLDADNHNSDGYLITRKRYGNFMISGENIVSARISMKNGRATCYLGADKPIKADKEITLTGEEINSNACALFFDFSDEIWQGRFLADDFSFAELDDEMTFAVTTEKDGIKATGEMTVKITFDENGVMHTALK